MLVLGGCMSGSENTTVESVRVPQEEKNIHGDIPIAAKPDSAIINVSTTAVIVVEMENDFGEKGGMFDRAGIEIAGIQDIVNPIQKVLDAARRAGIDVIYLKLGYLPDLSDLR